MGEKIDRPHMGRIKVQVADGRVMELERQTVAMHLILISSWGDVRVTLALLVMLGQVRIVILRDNTLKEMLGIAIRRQLKATVKVMKICGGKGSKRKASVKKWKNASSC